MSLVTGLVLVCGVTDGGDVMDSIEIPGKNIRAINSWLKERRFYPLVDVSEHSGGSKHPECCVFCCGYNYFPVDEFSALFRSMAWDLPEICVLLLKPEEGETRVLRPIEAQAR